MNFESFYQSRDTFDGVDSTCSHMYTWKHHILLPNIFFLFLFAILHSSSECFVKNVGSCSTGYRQNIAFSSSTRSDIPPFKNIGSSFAFFSAALEQVTKIISNFDSKWLGTCILEEKVRITHCTFHVCLCPLSIFYCKTRHTTYLLVWRLDENEICAGFQI